MLRKEAYPFMKNAGLPSKGFHMTIVYRIVNRCKQLVLICTLHSLGITSYESKTAAQARCESHGQEVWERFDIELQYYPK